MSTIRLIGQTKIDIKDRNNTWCEFREVTSDGAYRGCVVTCSAVIENMDVLWFSAHDFTSLDDLFIAVAIRDSILT